MSRHYSYGRIQGEKYKKPRYFGLWLWSFNKEDSNFHDPSSHLFILSLLWDPKHHILHLFILSFGYLQDSSEVIQCICWTFPNILMSRHPQANIRLLLLGAFPLALVTE